MAFRAPSSDDDDDEFVRDLPMAAMGAGEVDDSPLSDGPERSLALGGFLGDAPHMLAPHGPLPTIGHNGHNSSGLWHPHFPLNGLAFSDPSQPTKQSSTAASVGPAFAGGFGGWDIGIPIVPQPSVTPHLVAAMPAMPALQPATTRKPDHTVPAGVSSSMWCSLSGQPSELSPDICALLTSQGLSVMHSELSFSISIRGAGFTGVVHLEEGDCQRSLTQCTFRRVSGDAILFHDAYIAFTGSLPACLKVEPTDESTPPASVPAQRCASGGRFASSLLRSST